MSETTKEYFDREKESRFLLEDYLDSSEDEDRVEIVDKILWTWQIDDLLERETDEDWDKVLDTYETNRDEIDERVKEYFDLLSIEKWCQVDPRSNEVTDPDNSKYKLLISFGWPNVFREIDWTAELHLYWWSEHYSRDFGRSFADKLLSFYWLE